MRFFVTLAAFFAASVAVAGDFAASSPEPVSVLTDKPAASTSAPAEIVVVEPACAGGSCNARVYSTHAESRSSCRNRLFGGHVVRNHERIVVRPVRTAATRRCASAGCCN